MLGRRQAKVASDMPCVGQYEIKSCFDQQQKSNERPAPTAKPKKVEDNRSELHYPSFTESKKGYFFGYKINDLRDLKKEFPSPGSYNIREVEDRNRKAHQPGPKIGTSSREAGQGRGPMPGPGHYSPNYTVNASESSISFCRSAKNLASGEDEIGPGSYYPVYPSKERKYTIQGKHSQATTNPEDSNPGPGHYPIPDPPKHSAIKIKEPSFSARRRPKPEQDVPFSYDIPRFPEDKKFVEPLFTSYSKRFQTLDSADLEAP